MRSLLFVPGDSERKLAKALTCGADALIIDLEDGVAAEAKQKARALTSSFVARARSETTSRLYVRINSLDTTHWEEDLAAVVPAAPHGIVLPKPRSGSDVSRLSDALDVLEAEAGTTSGATRIIAIATEVPAALLCMGSFVGASTRLEGLAWGAEDLSAAVGATVTRDSTGALTSPFRLARDLCLITAAAACVAAIDGVYIDIRDLKGLAAETQAASRDGFTGKLAVHPEQVGVINAAFTPGRAEVDRARAIVRLFASHSGEGALSFDGEMVDRPHLERARRLLDRARLAGLDV
jgi:citrate lyase subunit beta/citryl-CoA lyase